MRTPLGPRLKHVAYLGSFKENNLAQDSTRAWFWQSARRRLDRLGICGKIASRDRRPRTVAAVALLIFTSMVALIVVYRFLTQQ